MLSPDCRSALLRVGASVPSVQQALSALALVFIINLMPTTMYPISSAQAADVAPKPEVRELPGGRQFVYAAFPSSEVEPRRVSVWVPRDYYANTDTNTDANTSRYAVLYMHDERNLFDPKTAMAGQTWGIDAHMAALQSQQQIRPTIVVGIDNTSRRHQEYSPEAVIRALPPALQGLAWPDLEQGRIAEPRGDRYLRFIVNELKPFIDAHYRTLPDRANTFMMGSSMGGIISLYGLASYPQVFGGAACLSTHWPISRHPVLFRPQPDARLNDFGDAYFRWLAQHLPNAGSHRLYFDHGSLNLDSLYAPYQAKMDAIMVAKSYQAGRDWMSQAFPGTDHNEPAWRARLEIPLKFLLRP